MSRPHGSLRASERNARPSASGSSTSQTTRSNSAPSAVSELARDVDAARGLHVEALLDHAELEDGRLLGIGVDEQHAVAAREELRLHVLAEDERLEEIEDARVEDGALVLEEHVHRLRRPEHLAERIARVLREVRVRVGDREEARAERDLLADELVGEALAVEALVHVEDGVLDRRREAHRLEQAERRVVRLLRRDAMALVLGAVERREVELAHLAEVVDVTGDDHRLRLGAIEVHALGDATEETRDLRRVTAQLLPRVLEQAHHHGEQLDRRVVLEDVAARHRRSAGGSRAGGFADRRAIDATARGRERQLPARGVARSACRRRRAGAGATRAAGAGRRRRNRERHRRRRTDCVRRRRARPDRRRRTRGGFGARESSSSSIGMRGRAHACRSRRSRRGAARRARARERGSSGASRRDDATQANARPARRCERCPSPQHASVGDDLLAEVVGDVRRSKRSKARDVTAVMLANRGRDGGRTRDEGLHRLRAPETSLMSRSTSTLSGSAVTTLSTFFCAIEEHREDARASRRRGAGSSARSRAGCPPSRASRSRRSASGRSPTAP